jgi:hypothetical protein
MDPFSISLGVITIVTALRDIIETVQVIRDSLSTVRSSNRIRDHHPACSAHLGINSVRRTIEMLKSLQMRC